MPGTIEQHNKTRLFFACWPDSSVREQILHDSEAIIIPNGRRIQAENLHLTLAFIGDVDTEKVSQYAEAAASVNAEAFDLTLQGYGHFKKPRVFYMGVDTIPSALMCLVSKLNQALQVCAYQPEQRAYTPHVSLFRRAETLPSIEQNQQHLINWHIDRFYLAESIYGPGHAIYKPIKEYLLKSL